MNWGSDCRWRWLGAGLLAAVAALFIAFAVSPLIAHVHAPSLHADRAAPEPPLVLARDEAPDTRNEAPGPEYRVRLDAGMQAACTSLPIELVTKPRPSTATLYAVHEPDLRSR